MIECRRAKRNMHFLTTSRHRPRTQAVTYRDSQGADTAGDPDASPEPKDGNELGSDCGAGLGARLRPAPALGEK